MKFGTLSRRNLRFYWRAHLGVVLGTAIGSAALIGALVVGDSVRESLRFSAIFRLAGTSVALDSGDRVFGDDLLERMLALKEHQTGGLTSNPTNTQTDWGLGNVAAESKIALRVRANVSRQDGSARANQINLFGFGDDVLEMIRSGRPTYRGDSPPPVSSGEVWINEALARQIAARPGDELLFRVQRPSALSLDSAISSRNSASVVMRLRVAGGPNWLTANLGPRARELIFNDYGPGGWPPTDLSLNSGPRPPWNAFVRIADLDKAVGLEGKANLILAKPAVQWRKMSRLDYFRSAWIGSRQKSSQNPISSLDWLRAKGELKPIVLSSRATLEAIIPVFDEAFKLEDAEVKLMVHQPSQESPGHPPVGKVLEMKSVRIFLDEPIVRAALVADTNAQPILTYLATLLRAGTNATPYSMVTAAGAPWTPADLREDEIVVSQWLAEDLQVKLGDEIAMSYFRPESGAKLTETTNTFRVRGIVRLEMPWADRTLMPDFPGIEKAESTREWDAGFPLIYKVRAKDDEYWKKHRGTPKAFITLATGQKIWGNRFGSLTAIRFPVPTNLVGTRSSKSPSFGEVSDAVERVPTRAVEEYRTAVDKEILANLKPEELGLRFEPVREQALKAAEQSQDFGGLFLGFSLFVIGAALLLMALLFSLGLEQRASEIGTLLALGFTPKQVRKLLLREGLALAFTGGMIGAVGGVYYAKVMLHGLATIWRDAVGATTLDFHISGQTLVIGIFASVIVSGGAIWLTLRNFVRRPARELLVGETQDAGAKGGSRGNVIGVAALVGVVGTVGWTLWSDETNNAESFFSAGSLVLVAGIAFVSAWLTRLAGGTRPDRRDGQDPPQRGPTGFSTGALAVRGCARRRKRSLSTVTILACGSFLIVSIGVFRLDGNRDATKRSSGTGGFALIGQTTMAVVQDLNSQSGRNFFAWNEKDAKGVEFVPFRMHEGDEASCLNLNAAQKPRLLGVKPELLGDRFTFTRSLNEMTKIGPWSALERLHLSLPLEKNEIPAIGDASSIQWAMHKKVGDTIDYVDERGQPFKVRIVGAVANSILQGQLIIDEAEFVKRFPGESGYRMFLVDAPSNAVSQVSATLSRALQDVGLELTPAAERLAQFNAVQNTYLNTFQVLGGLGLLLGSAGLGIVVLRNVLERRGELAVLMAVGFRRPLLQRLLMIETCALLGLGLAVGVGAAAVAVLPALVSPAAQLPYASLALTLGGVAANGALWAWAATRLAVRGDLLKALRNE